MPAPTDIRRPPARVPFTRLVAITCVVAIALVVLSGWRVGLFTQTETSYAWMLAGVAALALLAWAAVARPSAHRGAPATALAGLVAIGVVSYCGATNVLATGLLAMTAFALMPPLNSTRDMPAAVRLLVGLAIMVGIVGWLLPFPVHGTRVYLLAMGAICWWRREAVVQSFRGVAGAWTDLSDALPGWSILLVAVVSFASLGLWLPSLNYDDNAAHLLMPYQLLSDGYYHLDVATQIWAVAPWANNVLHSVGALVAGAETRAAINLLWLLIGINGAWRLAAALGGKPHAAMAAACLYGSLPLTGYFTTSMQVDAASAAVLLQLAALLVTCQRALPPAIVMGAFLGLLAGLKATNAIYALPAIAWVTWHALAKRDIRWLASVGLMAACVGGASYFYAVMVTGNPVFPLFNATFHSPYFPSIDFVDTRWSAGLSWHSLWDMTMYSERYGEVYPGAWGVALLALVPAIFVEVIRRRDAAAIVAWFAFSGLVIFWQIQYLRYVFPALAVLVVVGTNGLARVVGQRLFGGLIAVLVVADLLLLPSTSWMLRDNPWKGLISGGPSNVSLVEAEMTPQRTLLRRVLVDSPNGCVLMADPDSPYGGIGGGRAMTVKDPYDPRMAKASQWANADATGARWQQLLTSIGVSHVVLGPQVTEPLRLALVSHGFIRIDGLRGASTWASLEPAKRQCNGQMERVRDEAHRHLHPGDRH